MVISSLFFHLYLFVLSDHEQNHKLPPPLSKIPRRDNQKYQLFRRYKELRNCVHLNLYITGFPRESMKRVIKMRFEILSKSLRGILSTTFKTWHRWMRLRFHYIPFHSFQIYLISERSTFSNVFFFVKKKGTQWSM